LNPLRFAAFLAKEVLDVARQPRLLFILILGPFLILLLFGVGYTRRKEPVPMAIVAPADSQLPPDLIQHLQGYGEDFPVTVTPDRQWAESELRARRLEAIALVPSRTRDTLMSGRQVEIPIYINAISPLRRDYVDYVTTTIVRDINKELSRQAATQALSQAQVTTVSPEAIVEPVVTTTENVSRFMPTYVGFYAPGVLALLIQHIAVTFAALSLVRDQLQGTIELFRVSPLGPFQALFGKFLSYLLLTLAIALILALLLIFGLGVPQYGDPWQFLLLIVLEICASLAWGFFISSISPRESQAVQWAMILLLTSVFFSGFFLDLAGLIPSLQAISYSLPVTYGIAGLQQIMLAAAVPEQWHYLALGGITLILMLLAWLIYRRQFRVG